MIGRTNTGGGGGGGLNFQVVGGTTAPSNPKENMIWINTSSTITDWVFSATQPTAATGRVWISVDTSSTVEFNALKKNGIQVYPISAKQYVNGAWVDKTAMSYQGGAWAQWYDGELYYNGNEYTDITGGWTTFNHHSYTFNDSKCSKSDGKLTLKLPGGRNSVAFGTAKAVDLTDYTAIEFTVDTIYTECAFAVSTMRSTSSASNRTAQIVPKSAGVHNLDVSQLSGAYYIWFGDYSTSSVYGAVVSKVRLVK